MEERAASAGIGSSRTNMVARRTRVDADKRALKQILLNLLSNAIKFTPPGGTVTVSRAPRGRVRRLSRSRTRASGIAASDLQRIGNPFVQLGQQ